MDSLSERQRRILEFIRDRIRERGYPPSVREIGEAVGLTSSSTVHGHLARLEEKGYIRRDPTKPRAIELLEDGKPIVWGAQTSGVTLVPALGKVTAGNPILAIEDWSDQIPVPDDWARGADLFALTVRGDSMIEAGILEGDTIVVRRQNTAQNGDIVVALIGEEATVKTFYKEADHVRLQPENHRLEPILVKDPEILGKVIGLVRRF